MNIGKQQCNELSSITYNNLFNIMLNPDSDYYIPDEYHNIIDRTYYPIQNILIYPMDAEDIHRTITRNITGSMLIIHL